MARQSASRKPVDRYWRAWLRQELARWTRWYRELRRPRSLGERGEDAAARYLRRRKGYVIAERRARVKIGEIDIVALDRDCIVFIEVKTRRGKMSGRPADSVTRQKQGKITRVALAYLKRRRLMEHRARFDVIEVVWPEDARRPEITHFENAFEAPDGETMYG
jgi:putative endonuclease